MKGTGSAAAVALLLFFSNFGVMPAPAWAATRLFISFIVVRCGFMYRGLLGLPDSPPLR